MEYQILLEMIKEIKAKDPFFSHPMTYDFTMSKQYKVEIAVLESLKERIDKAREADIIAMSNEGCV